MIELQDISISNNGCRVEYKYHVGKAAKKYFKDSTFFVEYSQDITSVPKAILAIPFLANVMPIAWFAGFKVKLAEMDKTFLHSLEDYRNELSLYYPVLKNGDLNLKYTTVINTVDKIELESKKAMLFSGGVDAFATYFRNNNGPLDLITIHGADIKLEDEKLWLELKDYVESEAIIADENKLYVKSNFRDFITYEVNKLLPGLGWWGKIQHGIALTCLTAPVTYLNNYSNLFIASSYTRKPNYKFIVWGSMPETDNLIRWGNIKVRHDAENLTRQEKIEEIHKGAQLQKDKLNIRVCYSDYKEGVNCSVCEKCLRTIFGLMVIGANPNDYGFDVDSSTYPKLKKQVASKFTSEGNQLFWREIYLTAKESNAFFYFKDKIEEECFYNKILAELAVTTNSEIVQISRQGKLKEEIIQSFPKLFNVYLKVRRKFTK